MGLAEIEQKIIAEAEAEAAAIKAGAEAEAARIREAAAVKAGAISDKIGRETALKAEAVKQSIIAPARLQAKRDLLAEKHRLLDEVLAGLPDETREQKEITVGQFLYG